MHEVADVLFIYKGPGSKRSPPKWNVVGRASGCNSSCKQKHGEEKPHGARGVKVKQWALGRGQPTHSGFDCLDNGCSHERWNDWETERKENSAAQSQINGSWLESLVGGCRRVCSGGLTRGSGRDRPLTHSSSLWTTVSMIPVSGLVAGMVGDGGLQCVEEAVGWVLPEAWLIPAK